MQRDQRRRAGGIDGHARSTQVEKIRQPIRDHAVCRAGADICVDRLHRRDLHAVILTAVRDHTDEHAAHAACQLRARETRVLERLHCDFEEQALLRVHLARFHRCDSEVRGVEARDAVDERRVGRGHLARRIRIRVEKRVTIPPIRWHGRHGVDAARQILPERFRRVRTARQPTRHADDRNGVDRQFRRSRGRHAFGQMRTLLR